MLYINHVLFSKNSHYNWDTYNTFARDQITLEKISIKDFIQNLETFVSELLENIENMFSLDYMQNDLFGRYKTLTTDRPVADANVYLQVCQLKVYTELYEVYTKNIYDYT